MDIVIRKLTPELANDYLKFFDTEPHSTGKAEHRCYCVCWASTDGDAQACSTAEMRRTVAERYIRENYLQGYLAYCEDRVVGWCNANTKSDCYNCISWSMFMGEIKRDTAKVKSVFCFAIAPEYRRRGIASALLNRVWNDAQHDGFDCVEAYPNAQFVDTEQDFMGPIQLYRSIGFVDCYAAGNRMVMRKLCQTADAGRIPDDLPDVQAGN